MTLIRPIETETAVKEALELTEDLFLKSARALKALTERVEAGEVPVDATIEKTAAQLRERQSYMMKERARVLQQRKAEAGIEGDYAIDIDAVRAEIRGKLALLRDRGGADRVS